MAFRSAAGATAGPIKLTRLLVSCTILPSSTRLNPTRIFVSQSEISSRLVLDLNHPSLLCEGPLTLRGIANNNPSDAPTASDAEAVRRLAPNADHPATAAAYMARATTPTIGGSSRKIIHRSRAVRSGGSFEIRLNVWGTLWARLAFQFAHEYCHVLADPRSFPLPIDRCCWIEEVICETASLARVLLGISPWRAESC